MIEMRGRGCRFMPTICRYIVLVIYQHSKAHGLGCSPPPPPPPMMM
jgi:hypothetical protein